MLSLAWSGEWGLSRRDRTPALQELTAQKGDGVYTDNRGVVEEVFHPPCGGNREQASNNSHVFLLNEGQSEWRSNEKHQWC